MANRGLEPGGGGGGIKRWGWGWGWGWGAQETRQIILQSIAL